MTIDYTQYMSTTAKNLEPSGIRKFFDLAASMKDVVSLGVGEPDFVTPWNIREIAIEALQDGVTSYTANAGLPELRDEISYYLERRFHVGYSPADQIIVTVGASQSLDLAFRSILNQGDEVLIIEPAFVAYASIVALSGGVPVRITTKSENGFKVTPEEIEAAITERTKAILICSPNNPTGTCLNRDELTAISEVVERHDLLVVSDEIYAELTYDGEFTSFASIPGMYERTILINGFSKGFAMTGWRLGFLAAPRELVGVMVKIYQHTTMCAPTMLQLGAIEALKNSSKQVEKMRQNYWRRRNYFVSSLNKIGLPCHTPGGAFYVFPSINHTGMTSEEFAEGLLHEQKVAVVPGNAFGASGEGYIRCSYATSIEQLEIAVNRIGLYLDQLRAAQHGAIEQAK